MKSNNFFSTSYTTTNNYNEFISAAFRLHQTIHTDVQQLGDDYIEPDPTKRIVISDFIKC